MNRRHFSNKFNETRNLEKFVVFEIETGDHNLTSTN